MIGRLKLLRNCPSGRTRSALKARASFLAEADPNLYGKNTGFILVTP
jgi:hypothetical protein